MQSLSKFQVTTNSLLNWVLQDKDSAIKGKPSFVFDMFAEHLASAYENLTSAPSVKNINLLKFSKIDYQSEDLSFIIEIQSEIQKASPFSSFLIHGSCADLDMVPGWSDFDAIGVLKRRVSFQREQIPDI